MGDLVVGGRITLKGILKIGYDDVDWICLAWNRAEWRAVVNTLMNLRVP
jgi:hypothetical protein